MSEFVSNIKSIFNEDTLNSLFFYVPEDLRGFVVVCLIFLLGLAIKRIVWG